MKGVKFTPTPNRNVTELKQDIVEFTRRFSLIKMFSSEEQKLENEVNT